MRYAPVTAGKRALWERVIDPYLAWEPHAFVAPTVFGSRMAGETRDILQQYVYYFGVWEPNLTHWIGGRLAPGDIFVDVGANVGYFSLLGSGLVGPGGRVVAIEPSPRLYAALRANLARNGVRNVRALQRAVLDAERVVSLYAGTEHHSGLTTTREERGLAFECEVAAAALPALLEPDEMRSARLVKIDVEGAEWKAVAGMRPLFEAGRDDLEIVVEVDPELLAREGRRPDDLLAVFAGHGFHPYRLENDYAAQSYLAGGAPRPPERLRGPLAGVTDLVFSRVDAEHL